MKKLQFLAKKIPSIPGLGGIKDASGTHIGYKMKDYFENLAMSDGEAKDFVADYRFDLLAGKRLIFVCSNIIIEYQHMGDTKAALIRVIDSKQRLKNVSLCEIEPSF